jgi:hypothetical protein
MAGDTGPLPGAGVPSRTLPVQIARFGELAGRDLSARAFAALQARGPMTRSVTATPGAASR